jgi:hypothetical protein
VCFFWFFCAAGTSLLVTRVTGWPMLTKTRASLFWDDMEEATVSRLLRKLEQARAVFYETLVAIRDIGGMFYISIYQTRNGHCQSHCHVLSVTSIHLFRYCSAHDRMYGHPSACPARCWAQWISLGEGPQHGGAAHGGGWPVWCVATCRPYFPNSFACNNRLSVTSPQVHISEIF